MGTPIEFDLNAAFRNWRETLKRSSLFRAENLDELESHLRDSVTALQDKGLSPDEAFLIGTRRVGTVVALESEFAKENGGNSPREVLTRIVHMQKNNAIHGMIVLYFAVGCWFLWGILRVSQMVLGMSIRLDGRPAPAFTRMFYQLMPFWYVPPLLAAIYCVFVWFRKDPPERRWVGFFAVTTAALLLMTFPTIVASSLPVIDLLNNIAMKP